tara:strand:- start:1030 stop:2748 length:1719 start_codon:yes stop_codon:yes gene_type:complete
MANNRPPILGYLESAVSDNTAHGSIDRLLLEDEMNRDPLSGLAQQPQHTMKRGYHWYETDPEGYNPTEGLPVGASIKLGKGVLKTLFPSKTIKSGKEILSKGKSKLPRASKLPEKFAQVGERKVGVAEFTDDAGNIIKQPMYQSTGTSGHGGFRAGQWMPFVGMRGSHYHKGRFALGKGGKPVSHMVEQDKYGRFTGLSPRIKKYLPDADRFDWEVRMTGPTGPDTGRMKQLSYDIKQLGDDLPSEKVKWQDLNKWLKKEGVEVPGDDWIPKGYQQGSIVRDYVSPTDSAHVVDYLMDFLNRTDIPEIYSKEVAGIPVIEDKSLEDKTGEFVRRVKNGKVIRNEIRFQPDEKHRGYGRWWYTKDEIPELDIDKKISIKKTPSNTILHEAFGHALIDAIYGYHKKPHWTRNEVFPYMIQTYSELKSLEDEYGKSPELIQSKSYQKTKDAFETMKKLSRAKGYQQGGQAHRNLLMEALSQQPQYTMGVPDKPWPMPEDMIPIGGAMRLLKKAKDYPKMIKALKKVADREKKKYEVMEDAARKFGPKLDAGGADKAGKEYLTTKWIQKILEQNPF